MRRSTLHAVVLCMSAFALLVIATPAASAHEQRTVAGYSLVVGWGDEPTYTGFKNSVQLILSRQGEGVPDLGDTLKVDVASGGRSVTQDLVPNFEPGEFGEVGDYRAWIVPTRPGTYAFHFTGTIKGTAVDETFTCSEQTFDCPREPTSVEFPARDPSTAQLSDRVDRQSGRLERRLASVNDDADQGRLFGLIGIAVGALGLIVGAAAVRRAGRNRG
jgi:hypothetical protein